MASPTTITSGAGPEFQGRKEWDDLAATLSQEARLLDELREALLQQRAGVASNDAAVVEGSIQMMGRTLLTLGEARQRREALICRLAGQPVSSPSISDLEELLSQPLPEDVQTARAAARRSGAAVAREVAINHHVVRRALEAGEAFIQLLFSSVADPNPAYMPSHKNGGDTSPTGGLLLNKRM